MKKKFYTKGKESGKMRKLPNGISNYIPNDVIRKIYSEYFLTYISKKAEIQTDDIDTEEIKMIPKIKSYSVVAIKDELYIEEN